MLEGWRARGADRVDPVRFRFIEAIARRAAAHDGEARRLLDEKLRALLAAYRDAIDAQPAVAATDPPRSAFEDLLAHVAQQSSTPGTKRPELKTVQYFSGTWSRLRTERRLTQSRALVPENAGPLNSQHLVHRMLTLMREASPAYLQQFMAHVDALLWLDQLQASLAPPPAPPPPAPRKTTRRKGG